MVDIHSHSRHCPHAEGEIAKYVHTAFVVRNLKVFGFSEHFPLPDGFADPFGDSAMKPDALKEYLSEIRALGNPNVLTGMEIDFLPEYKEDIVGRLGGLQLDYVIGSIHFIMGWGFDYSEEEFEEGLEKYFDGDIEECVIIYFDLLRQLIALGIIDIVGHIDLIKKFNKDARYFSEDNPVYREIVEETLRLVREKGLLVEVNTAGIDKAVGKMYPSRAILKRCYELGIGLTLGSDAHKPERVGRYFDGAIALIKDIGYTKLHYAKGGEVKEVDI